MTTNEVNGINLGLVAVRACGHPFQRSFAHGDCHFQFVSHQQSFYKPEVRQDDVEKIARVASFGRVILVATHASERSRPMPRSANDNAKLNSLKDARRLARLLVDQFGSEAQAKADRLLKVLALLGPMRKGFRRELFKTIVALEIERDA